MNTSKRILLTLSGKLLDSLLVVQKQRGIRSPLEIIKFALSLYFTIYKRAGQGYELCMKKGNEIRSIDVQPGFLPDDDLVAAMTVPVEKDHGKPVDVVGRISDPARL